MRQITILILTLTLIPSLVTSQTKQKPQCYLNSKEFDLDCVFFLPKNIESINVKKDKPNGEVFITTKEKPWKYKTLEILLKTLPNYSQIIDKSIIPIYIIDGKLIKNMSDIEIDDSYFASATLSSLSDVSGVKDDCKKIVLVNIKLSDDPKKLIMIRGNDIPEVDFLINNKK